MNTFTSDYISNTPTGMTANVVRSIPRATKMPIVISKPPKKQLKEIKELLIKFTDLLVKIN